MWNMAEDNPEVGWNIEHIKRVQEAGIEIDPEKRLAKFDVGNGKTEDVPLMGLTDAELKDPLAVSRHVAKIMGTRKGGWHHSGHLHDLREFVDAEESLAHLRKSSNLVGQMPQDDGGRVDVYRTPKINPDRWISIKYDKDAQVRRMIVEHDEKPKG
jgi:hypothetical protein